MGALPIDPESIRGRMRVVRGATVLLSSELAVLYDVQVRSLVQAVKRNAARFPPDFMFQLTAEEAANLKSRSVTSSWGGARRAPPYAFTEQGVAMLSSVLRSARAIAVNIEIMRAFVQLRRWALTHAELARRIDGLERGFDARFKAVFDALRALASPADAPRDRIGFRTSPDG
jgi:hypothetical protein